MRGILPLLLVLALVPISLAMEAVTGSASATRNCAPVRFTPNSDDVASAIQAKSLTCGLARDFVRDSSGRPGKRFRGFTCTSTSVETTELPSTRYRCTGAGDVIRWRRL